MDIDKILSIPWAIQLCLGSGYAAYLLSYAGIRSHHKTIEVTFASLMFGLVAAFVLQIGRGLSSVPVAIFAVICTLLSGAVWRIKGRDLLRNFQRMADLSWSDDTPSAWAAMAENRKHVVSGIAVQLDDGCWLRCDDTSRFSSAAFNPCILGTEGDVALYLTHRESSDGTVEEQLNVLSNDHGDRLTYIPASRVREVSIRFKAS